MNTTEEQKITERANHMFELIKKSTVKNEMLIYIICIYLRSKNTKSNKLTVEFKNIVYILEFTIGTFNCDKVISYQEIISHDTYVLNAVLSKIEFINSLNKYRNETCMRVMQSLLDELNETSIELELGTGVCGLFSIKSKADLVIEAAKQLMQDKKSSKIAYDHLKSIADELNNDISMIKIVTITIFHAFNYTRKKLAVFRNDDIKKVINASLIKKTDLHLCICYECITKEEFQQLIKLGDFLNANRIPKSIGLNAALKLASEIMHKNNKTHLIYAEIINSMELTLADI